MQTKQIKQYLSPYSGVESFQIRNSEFGIRSCLFAVLLLLASCSKPTDPPPPPPPSGPDTTSHDFIWQIDTLGDGNSSILYDVAIIDENNIWAVGELYFRNTNGQIDPTPYALAKWNGTEWSFETVPYHDFGSTQKYPGPLFTIQAFGPNDVYVCSYANLLHWDGMQWTEKAFFMESIPFENQILKMWGSDGSNIYCIGRKGGIFHFNGTSWSRIESGTGLNLNDVWGEVDDKGEFEILATAANVGQSLEHALLKIDANGVVSQTVGDIEYAIRGIWFRPGIRYFVVGGGTYWKSTLTDSLWSGGPFVLTQFFSEAVRGSDTNNVFIAGDFNDVLHYNGSTWRSYPELYSPTDAFDALAVTESLVVLVSRSGIVVRGHRP